MSNVDNVQLALSILAAINQLVPLAIQLHQIIAAGTASDDELAAIDVQLKEAHDRLALLVAPALPPTV